MASKHSGPRSQPARRPPRNKAPQVAVEVVVQPGSGAVTGDQVEDAAGALADNGITVSGDALGFVSTGPIETVVRALGDLAAVAMDDGATSVRIHITQSESELAVAPLHDALDSMVRAAERSIGKRPSEWSRQEKRTVVHQLDTQGAFLLRGAVDDLARIMGVSRITVYNYLNAIDRG